MADSAIYIVQIRCDRTGVRALARAATSASTEEFTSPDALWRFLVSEFRSRSGAEGDDEATNV
jgi:hypothetical protein